MNDVAAQRDPARASDAGLDRAHRTLCNGAAFFRRPPRHIRPDPTPARNLLGEMADIRWLGNGLRELDRFLGLLIEEVGRRIGAMAHDPTELARMRHTANKLRLVRATMGLGCSDHAWLCAVGRLRACLHHCGGEVRRRGDAPHLAFAGGAIVERTDSERDTVTLNAPAIDRIATVYARVGNDLMAELERWTGRAA